MAGTISQIRTTVPIVGDGFANQRMLADGPNISNGQSVLRTQVSFNCGIERAQNSPAGSGASYHQAVVGIYLTKPGDSQPPIWGPKTHPTQSWRDTELVTQDIIVTPQILTAPGQVSYWEQRFRMHAGNPMTSDDGETVSGATQSLWWILEFAHGAPNQADWGGWVHFQVLVLTP